MATKRQTPIQSIKAYCKYECSGGINKVWKNCNKTDCKLYSYRLGHRPSKIPFEVYCTKKHRDLALNSPKNNDVETINPNKIATSPKSSVLLGDNSPLDLVSPLPRGDYSCAIKASNILDNQNDKRTKTTTSGSISGSVEGSTRQPSTESINTSQTGTKEELQPQKVEAFNSKINGVCDNGRNKIN